MYDIEKMTAKQIIENCEVIKELYTSFLSPFFEKEMVKYFKNVVYSLEIPEWKQDKIWEYFNGDIDEKIFKKIIGDINGKRIDIQIEIFDK